MPKRKFSRLTNAEKQTLRSELDAKISVTALAEKYGVSRRTIYNLKNKWEDRLPQSRSKVLTVRVSEEDIEHLDALAKKVDMSRAAMVRSVLLYASEIYHIEPAEAGELAELTGEISKIGQNVNQIARAVNLATVKGQQLGPHFNPLHLKQQLSKVTKANDEVRTLMIRRAQKQRAHISKIISTMSSS